VIDTGNRAVFAYARLGDDRTVTCLVNFTDQQQQVWVDDLPLEDKTPQKDLLTGQPMLVENGVIKLAPYQSMWFRPI
jgi:amylosucrase